MIQKQELETAVQEGLSLNQLATRFRCAPATVRHWMKQYRLKTLRALGLRVVAQTADGMRYCPACETSKVVTDFYTRRQGTGLSGWCKACSNQSALERQRETKRKGIEYLGGSCEICGYDRYYGALEFHHKDPTQKDPSWSTSKSRSFESLKVELDKCALLCANCHRETHASYQLS
jgi:5-methylcytosine-specific restriction endonuclease McrA